MADASTDGSQDALPDSGAAASGAADTPVEGGATAAGQIVQFTRSQLGSRNGHAVATVFMRLLVKHYERVRRLPEKSEQRALKAEALA